MHKVNWNAKQNFEIVANYKVLQDCFTKLHIDKHIEVTRLIGGRYMDNLEFMQWFKRFFEMSVTDLSDYDPKAQRSKGKGAASLKPAATKAGTKSAATRVATKIVQKENKEPAPKTAPAATMRTKSSPQIPPKAESSAENDKIVTELKASNLVLTQSVEHLKGEIAGLEKERDFYFEKLRDVEILLQELEDSGQGNETITSIFKILYATAEGFEAVEEDVMHHSHVAKDTDVAIEEETY